MRLKEAGYGNTETYKRYAGVFVPLAEVRETDLPYKLSLAYRFKENKSSTVKGMRAAQNRAIETLKKGGIEFVDKHNIDDFGRFMAYYRSSGIAHIYDSERALEFYGEKYEEAEGDTETLLNMFNEYVSEGYVDDFG